MGHEFSKKSVNNMQHLTDLNLKDKGLQDRFLRYYSPIKFDWFAKVLCINWLNDYIYYNYIEVLKCQFQICWKILGAPFLQYKRSSTTLGKLLNICPVMLRKISTNGHRSTNCYQWLSSYSNKSLLPFMLNLAVTSDEDQM